MSTIRLVIFDIAGTIIEDHGEVLSSFALALEKNRIPAAQHELIEWKGAAKREVIRHFVERKAAAGERPASDDIERTYSDFRQILEQQYELSGVVPIKGVQQTLEWLLERNICIAATTGFERDVTDMILAKAGWQPLFANNVCSTDVVLGRPAPYMIFHAMEAARVTSVEQVVSVGDTPLDLQAASNAGVKGAVGVLTGTHREDRLRREPHTHILPSVAGLPSLLRSEFGVS